MTWNDAMTWASNLSYYDSVRNVTYTDWRLPTSDTCSGYNCTGSEMGHLFYNVLGGTNIQPYFYWSGTEYASYTDGAWFFNFGNGSQGTASKSSNFFAWAVRPGDVAVVPLPAAMWLSARDYWGW